MAKEFDIDPRNKWGANIEWESGDDFSAFVDALNRGAVMRGDGLPGVADAPSDAQLDEIAFAELRAKFAAYR